MTTQLNHAVPQINTVPSIRWSDLQAPCAAIPTERYQGHGKSGGIQLHSMDATFAHYGIVMQCVEGASGRRIWQALKGEHIVFSHPKHDAALAGAVMVLTGA